MPADEATHNIDWRALADAAAHASARAYAPYSHFAVGAAVLTAEGKIFSGCNVENASYGLSMCAERAAVFEAVKATEGAPILRAVLILTDPDRPAAPCGACRQVLSEFGDPLVSYQAQQGRRTCFLADLLPEAFSLP